MYLLKLKLLKLLYIPLTCVAPLSPSHGPDRPGLDKLITAYVVLTSQPC